ncbi:MAG: hypothetical protein AMXMBFR59_39970 [Rhodanobacteraceae bacterium]
MPQHVVQRGNNRLLCFLDDDRWRYLHLLQEALTDTAAKLPAYVPAGNHIHL